MKRYNLEDLIENCRPEINLMDIPYDTENDNIIKMGYLAEKYVQFWLRRVHNAQFNLEDMSFESTLKESHIKRNNFRSLDIRGLSKTYPEFEIDDFFEYESKVNLVEVKSNKLDGFKTKQLPKYLELLNRFYKKNRGVIILFCNSKGKGNVQKAMRCYKLKIIDLDLDYNKAKCYVENNSNFQLFK